MCDHNEQDNDEMEERANMCFQEFGEVIELWDEQYEEDSLMIAEAGLTAIFIYAINNAGCNHELTQMIGNSLLTANKMIMIHNEMALRESEENEKGE